MRGEKRRKLLSKNLKERDRLEDTGAGGKSIQIEGFRVKVERLRTSGAGMAQLRIGQLRKFGSICGRNRLLFLQNAHTGSGTHSASCLLAAGGSWPDNKAAGA